MVFMVLCFLVSGRMVLCLYGFMVLVFKSYGFIVLWFLWFYGFLVSCFTHFHSMFLLHINLISRILKIFSADLHHCSARVFSKFDIVGF